MANEPNLANGSERIYQTRDGRRVRLSHVAAIGRAKSAQNLGEWIADSYPDVIEVYTEAFRDGQSATVKRTGSDTWAIFDVDAAFSQSLKRAAEEEAAEAAKPAKPKTPRNPLDCPFEEVPRPTLSFVLRADGRKIEHLGIRFDGEIAEGAINVSTTDDIQLAIDSPIPTDLAVNVFGDANTAYGFATGAQAFDDIGYAMATDTASGLTYLVTYVMESDDVCVTYYDRRNETDVDGEHIVTLEPGGPLVLQFGVNGTSAWLHSRLKEGYCRRKEAIALDSFLLALAAAGVDVTSARIRTALTSALDALAQ